jgi:hypothetical protein
MGTSPAQLPFQVFPRCERSGGIFPSWSAPSLLGHLHRFGYITLQCVLRLADLSARVACRFEAAVANRAPLVGAKAIFGGTLQRHGREVIHDGHPPVSPLGPPSTAENLDGFELAVPKGNFSDS